MAKYNLLEIDTRVTKGLEADLKKAMNKVCNHILRNIDPTFPKDEFFQWLESGEDGPFRWNGNRYYWQ